jgi:hypothetical protein
MVSYRYKKTFTAGYIDEDKKETKKTYEMFVRDLDLDVKNVGFSEEDFLEKEAGWAKDINGSHFFLLDLEKAYRIMYHDIQYNNARNLCKYKGQ